MAANGNARTFSATAVVRRVLSVVRAGQRGWLVGPGLFQWAFVSIQDGKDMLAYRKWTALVVAALALWLGQVHAEQRPEVADQVVAYMGAQGTKVWTLRIGERAANEALVQIEGIDHDWNMRIQKMQVEKTSKDTRYSTTVDGKKYVVLIIQGNWGGELNLPGEAQTQQVGYSEGLSREGNAQAFLTDYLAAQNSEAQ